MSAGTSARSRACCRLCPKQSGLTRRACPSWRYNLGGERLCGPVRSIISKLTGPLKISRGTRAVSASRPSVRRIRSCTSGPPDPRTCTATSREPQLATCASARAAGLKSKRGQDENASQSIEILLISRTECPHSLVHSRLRAVVGSRIPGARLTRCGWLSRLQLHRQAGLVGCAG
jgi:hypothetical protein